MDRAPLARSGLLAISVGMVVVLLALANQYGFHRDELYFIVAGRHPDWGYVDQPPLTPLLSAAAVAMLGLSPLAIRVLPALAMAATVLLVGMMARDLGGSRRAQLLAGGVAAVSALLGVGHLDSTTTYDLLVWAVATWLVIRLLAGGSPRAWLLVGLVAGIGLQNKQLILLFAASLFVGLVVARRFDQLRSPWTWGGVAIALLIWLPNLAWQVSRGFPQLEMGSVIAARTSLGDVISVLPFQLILAGPFLWPVLVLGVWWLLRAPESQRWRSLGWAYLALLVITLLVRGKVYYPAGLIGPMLAAGAIPVDGWLSRGRRRLRMAVLAVAGTASAATIAVIMLPILTPATLAKTLLPDIYGESAEQIGWPELVATVQGVVDELPADQRDRAAVLTANYGEAGALTLLGGDEMPPVFSGHNSFADWGPAPDDRTVAILVGFRSIGGMEGRLGPCEQRAVISNPAGIKNEELGAPVWVCPEPASRWSEIWDQLRFLS